MSRAYGRSSRWEGSEAPAAASFAVAVLRPLRPLPLANSLRIATTDPARFAADLSAAEHEQRLSAIDASARGIAALLGPPAGDAPIGVAEALLFSNNDRLARSSVRWRRRPRGRAQADRRSRTVGGGRRAERPLARAEADETRVLKEYLADRSDRRDEAIRQLVWALLTCSEFRFNH